MSALRCLLTVGSITGSAGVYVSAKVLQLGLGLFRVVVFAFLLAAVQEQYGVWALGAAIFAIATPLMTFGSTAGVVRYVSFYEARGRLMEFYRRVRLGVGICALVTFAVAGLGSGLLTRLVVTPLLDIPQMTWRQQLVICWAALANALAVALYHNMLSFLIGLRVYRLASAVEIFFGLSLTVFSVGALLIWRSGLALLLGHLAAVTLTLTVGAAMLHVAVRWLAEQSDAAGADRGEPEEALVVEPEDPEEVAGTFLSPGGSADAAGPADRILSRLWRFSVPAMVGNLLWLAAGRLGFFLIMRRDTVQGGVFDFFWRLGQPILFLSHAAWSVVYTHVAKYWETRRRDEAMLILQTAYKVICLTIMTVTLAVYLVSPLWIRLLPPAWRGGAPLLGGLLMFFLTVCHMAILSMTASLQERPIVSGLVALVGGGSILALATWWMSVPGAAAAQVAWACGTGMYFGGGAVAVIYLACGRRKLQRSTYFVLAAPGLLLTARWLPVWVPAAVWAGVLGVAVFSDWVFTPGQKEIFLRQLAKVRAAIQPRKSNQQNNREP